MRFGCMHSEVFSRQSAVGSRQSICILKPPITDYLILITIIPTQYPTPKPLNSLAH